MRTRYKFSHRAGDRYFWHSTHRGPRESRTEEISVHAPWFWNHDIHVSDGPHWCTDCGKLRALVRQIFPERYEG